MRDKTISFNVGPPIPLVPNSKGYWVSKPKGLSLDDAWHLVGPTIQRNLRTTRADEQWKLYAIAFVEGMRMCLHGLEERQKRDESRRQELRASEESTPSIETGGVQTMGPTPRVHYTSFPTDGDIRSIEDREI